MCASHASRCRTRLYDNTVFQLPASHYLVHSLILLLFYRSIASTRGNQLRAVIAIIPEMERTTKRKMNLKPCVRLVISAGFFLGFFPLLVLARVCVRVYAIVPATSAW